MTQNASDIGAKPTVRSSRALRGIVSQEVPPKKKKPWRKKEYNFVSEFQRVTRRTAVSDIEGENGRVAEAATQEHVERIAEGVVSATDHGRDSAQALHVEQRRCDTKRDGAVMAIEQEEAVEMTEVRTSLVPGSRGKDVRALQQGKMLEQPTSKTSSLVNHLEDKKAARSKSKIIREVGHSSGNKRSLSSGEGIEAGLVQPKGVLGQAGLSDHSVDLALKVSEVNVPNRDGNGQQAPEDEGKQTVPQGLPAHDSISRQVSQKYHVKQSSLEKGVAGDSVESNRVEGRAHTLNGALQVTQAASEVGGDLTLRSSGALGGIASHEDPPERKKRKREKDFILRTEFQRVTRRKAVSSIEGEGEKNDRVTEAVAIENVEVGAEGFVSTADNGTHSTLLEATDVEKGDLKQREELSNVPSFLDRCATASVRVTLRNETKENLVRSPDENAFGAAKISKAITDSSGARRVGKRRSDSKGAVAGMAIEEDEGGKTIEVQKLLVPRVTRRRAVSSIDGEGEKNGRVAEAVAIENVEIGVEGVVSTADNGTHSTLLDATDVAKEDLRQGEELSNVPSFLDRCATASVSVALRNETEENLVRSSDENSFGSAKISKAITDSSRARRVDKRRSDSKGAVAGMAIEEEEGVKTMEVQKSFVPRVTRRRAVSSIDGEGEKNDRVAEAVAIENVEVGVEGVVSTADNGTHSTLLEATDVEKGDLKQREELLNVPSFLDKCATASVRVTLRNETKENLVRSPDEDAFGAAKRSKAITDSSRTRRVGKRRSDSKGAVAGMAIEEEEGGKTIEFQKLLVPRVTRRRAVSSIDGEGEKNGRVAEAVAIENVEIGVEGVVSTADNGTHSTLLEATDVEKEDLKQGEELSNVPSFLDRCATASVSVALRNETKENLVRSSDENAFGSAKISEAITNSSRARRVGKRRSDSKGAVAGMAIEEEEGVKTMEVQKSFVPRVTRRRAVSSIDGEGEKNDRVAEAVAIENVEMGAEGVVSTADNGTHSTLLEATDVEKGDLKQGEDLSNVPSLLDKCATASVSVALRNETKASLVRSPKENAFEAAKISKAITDSSGARRVGKRRSDSKGAVEGMAIEEEEGVKPIEVQKSLVPRVTRRRAVSSIEGQGEKNDRVAEAVAIENVEISAEGIVSTADNGTHSTFLEAPDVEKGDLEQGGELSNVPSFLDMCGTASVSVALGNETKESLVRSPKENSFGVAKISKATTDSSRARRVGKRKPDSKGAVEGMAIEEEEGVKTIEVQKSLVPRVTRRRAVSNIEGQGGKNERVAEAVTEEHVEGSAEGVSATDHGRDSAQAFHVEQGRCDTKCDGAVMAIEEEEDVEMMEVRKSLVPESSGEGVCALQERRTREQPTSNSSSLVNHLEEKKAARGKSTVIPKNGGTADTLQSNRVEGRSETLNGPMELTPTASQVGVERTLRSTRGRTASDEVLLKRKRPPRRDHRLGVEFQRVTRRTTVSNIEGQGGKDDRVTEVVTREHGEGSAEGIVSGAENGTNSASLEGTEVGQGEKSSDVPRLLDKGATASVSVPLRNGPEESSDFNPVENACMAGKGSEELADSSQLSHLDQRHPDPKGGAAVMTLEEEEDVEVLEVQKSLVPESRGKDVWDLPEGERCEEPTLNASSLLNHLENKVAPVAITKVIPVVGHFIENDLSLSFVEGVEGGLVQSKGFVGQTSLLGNSLELTLEASQVSVPIADGNGQKASDDEDKQKLQPGLPADGSIWREIAEEVNVKDLPLVSAVAEETVQSKRVEGRAKTLNCDLEVTQSASQVGAGRSLRSAGGLGGVASGEVLPKGKKPSRKKVSRVGVDFQRVTRRKTVSNIEGQGGKNGRVAEAFTSEHVEACAEGALLTAWNGRDSTSLEETDVEKEHLKQGKKSSYVPSSIDKCSTASVSVALGTVPTESLGLNPVQNAGMPGKTSDLLADACETFHMDQSRFVPKSDAAVIGIELEEEVEMMEKSLVPGAPGMDVSTSEKGRGREEPTTNVSSLVKTFEEKKAGGGKSKMIREVGHFIDNDRSFAAGEGVEAGLVQSVQQASLLKNSVDLAFEVSEMSVPNGDGNVHKTSDDEGKQNVPQGLTTHDDTPRAVPQKYHVRQLSLEEGVKEDTVQLNLVEGRAEIRNGALEVTQTVSKVGGDLTSQCSGALGGIASREGPLERKKLKRKKDFCLGAEFQRVTRGKAVSSIEGEGDKNGRVAEVGTRDHGDITAEGAVSTANNGRDSARASEVNKGRSDSKGDPTGIAVEEKDDVETMDFQKSVAPESRGKGVCALQKWERCEEPRSNSSSLPNHLEDSETPVHENFRGQHHGEPAGKFSDVQKNELLSKGSVSPVGPFAVEDRTYLKSRCGQEKAPITNSSCWNQQVSRSHYLEKIYAVDLSDFLTAQKTHSISMLDNSESVTMVETFTPVATIVKSGQAASVLGNDPATAVVESDFVTSIVESTCPASRVESGIAASRVESDPAASTVESDSVASIVEQRPIATEVESCSFSTIFDSDAITIAEGLEYMITSDNSTADIAKSITSEIMLETITGVGKPECVTAVDKSTFASISDKAAPVATVKNPSLPLAVVNAEVREIDSVQESTARSTEGESSGRESLITEAMNSQQEHVALEVPSEDFGLKDDISTKSPRLQPASAADDSAEPIKGSGDESGIKFENHGMQQGKSTQTPAGQVTQVCCLQHSGVSDGNLAAPNGSDEQTSSQERYQSATPSPNDLCRRLPVANDDDCTTACDGFSRLQKILEGEELEQKSHREAADVTQQGQPAPVEDSVRKPVSDLDDFLQDTSVPSEPSTSRRRRARVELVPRESSRLELTGQKNTVESSDLKWLEQSEADRTPHEGPRDTLEDHLDLSSVQVMASCSPKPIALAMDRKEVHDDSRISRVEDSLADNDPYQEKLKSGLENLCQQESGGQKPDEPILKAWDEREVIEVNVKVQEVHIEANDVRTAAMHLYSDAEEIVAEGEVNAVAREVNLNVEKVSLVMEMTQDVQADVLQVQAEVDEVQVEVVKTQVEVHMVDGAHDSLEEDTEFGNEDTKGKRLDIRAEEMPVEVKEVPAQLKVHIEAPEVDSEQEVDGEVKDPVTDEVTKADVHDNESVLGLDNLETAASSQHLASNNLVQSSVSDGVLVLSVPEEDISRPLGIPFHPQAQAVDDLMHTDSVPWDNDKGIHLSEQVLLEGLQLGQLTSPVKAGQCLEGDILLPEELSDIPMELHEKEDPKNQPVRSEDPNSRRNAIKGCIVYRKRKGRVGSEALNIVGHEGGDRVSSKKKGYLLASTAIESGGMRIRPRPLDPDQSIPILVEGRDKDFYEYDGGSFYRWVQQQEEARLKKPTVDPAVDGVSQAGGTTTVSDLMKRRPIFIPLFRKLPDDPQTNSQLVTRPEHDVLPSFPRPEAYLRHNKSAARTLGNVLGCSYSTVPPVYDMDGEDEEWLRGYNENLEQSGQDQRLSEDIFEEIIELFEREFYRISQINNNPAVLTKSLGDKGGAYGHRGKRLDAESSQRPSRMESKLLKSLESPASQTGIERRFALENGSEYCCICNGGENSDCNATFVCKICSVKVHQSCYGVRGTDGNDYGHFSESANWCCRKCEAVVGGTALPSISCAICCKSGGAMKPTVDPSKWAHVACALYTNETFFVDADSMEPVDGLDTVEARVKKQPLRCGLCGAREGSCVRCSTRGCRSPFHISCGLSQGAAFEFRHQKDLVVGVRSICPLHASFVPGAGDPAEVLPAVSTESSDTLEMRHVEHTNMGAKGSGTDGAIMNGADYQGSIPEKTNLNRSESRRYLRKKRTGARPGVTRSKPDASSRPHKISEEDVHVVSRPSPRSGSILQENMQGVPPYIDETDSYLHSTAEEKLESEAVSAATSGSSSHLAVAFENVDETIKVTTIGEEVDPVNSGGKGKSVPWDAGTSFLADKTDSDSVSLEVPSLETLDTNLATPDIVKAVYSFWQSKRVKAKGPILPELRQLQAARSQGIFNKVVQRSSELLPPVGHDSPSRIPVTRRPRSLGTRDPVASRFSELRQQLEMLRSIAGTVVHREQLKLQDQRLLYECTQQRLLLARDIPKSGRCVWCEKTNNLLSCSSCPRAFCFQCFKRTRGYGVKGWIAASKQEKYVCNLCSGSTPQEETWPELGTNLPTFSEPRGTPVSRVASVPGRVGDWNHGLEVRTKSNSGKQVSFLNETTWKGDPPSNPYGSSSSTLVPGLGKMIYAGESAGGQAACTKFAVPSTTERNRAVNRADHDGVLSTGPNDPKGEESRVQADLPHEEGKKVKRRKVRVSKKQSETVLRTTKRIKKLARSPSFVYGSDDETTLSESDESRTDKKTVKLSDLRDKGAKSRCTNLLEAGAEVNKKEKRHPPLKCIKFASGKLILRRHGPPQDP